MRAVLPSVFAKRVCGAGLRFRQADLFREVFLEMPNGFFEVTEPVLLSNSGMSRRVTALVAAGLVTRKQSERDGRVFRVKLTTKGRKALDATWKRYRPLIDDVFSRFLTEKEALVMAELLQKILHGTGLERHRDLLEKGMTDAPK